MSDSQVFYPWRSSQRNSPVVCFQHGCPKNSKIVPFQLPNFSNSLNSKLQTYTIFISCHKSPVVLKKSPAAIFPFSCFPVPHPFHLSQISFRSHPYWFPVHLLCVHRDQIGLSKTLALIGSFSASLMTSRQVYRLFRIQDFADGHCPACLSLHSSQAKSPYCWMPEWPLLFCSCCALHSLPSHSRSPFSSSPYLPKICFLRAQLRFLHAPS